MPKILPDGRIQVEQGDTPGSIYGADWQNYYKGDPTKLQIGAILPAKQTTSPLPGSLPAPTPSTNTGNVQLPETQTDSLSSFRNLLQTVSARATQESRSAGVGAMNFDPSKVSGGTLSGILDFINKQKTTPISDIYKATTNFFDQQQKAAQDQIQTLISSGAIANLTDASLSKLAVASGMDLETLKALKDQKSMDNSKPTSFITVKRGGVEYRVGYDKSGKEISATPTGADAGGGNQSEAELKRQAIKDMDLQISNVLGSDGYISPDDWSIAKNAWLKQGLNGADFESIFAGYQNPNNNDYPI